MNGHSTSGCALATVWGALSDFEEKKFETRSLNEGELAGAEGAAGGGAAAVSELAGTEPVVTGEPMLLLPEHPAASSEAASAAAIGRCSLYFSVESRAASPTHRHLPERDLIPKTGQPRPRQPRPRATAMPRVLYQTNHGHPKAAFSPKPRLVKTALNPQPLPLPAPCRRPLAGQKQMVLPDAVDAEIFRGHSPRGRSRFFSRSRSSRH